MENWYLCIFLLKGLIASYALGHLLGKTACEEYRSQQTKHLEIRRIPFRVSKLRLSKFAEARR